ncbi:MAG: hypothetical protein ACLVJ6_15400 [Merdibacter sp.]
MLQLLIYLGITLIALALFPVRALPVFQSHRRKRDRGRQRKA